MNPEEMYIVDKWGIYGVNVVKECKRVTPFNDDLKSFLDHCITCGGDWCAMLLSGIKELYPVVWDAIPDNMGSNAFICVANTLILLGVDLS